jgi:hypothetical protein
MAAQRNQPKLVDLDGMLPEICAAVKSHGYVTWAALNRFGINKTHRTALTPKLLQAGFEVTSRLVRIPAAQQIQEALASKGQLPLKGLHQIIVGFTAKELAPIVEQLVRSGVAVRLLRTKAEWLARRDVDVLTEDELRALNRCVHEWAKQTSQVMASRRRGLFVWRQDVRALLEVLATFDVARTRVAATADNVRQHLLETIRNQVNPSVGMAFVPTVVQSLQLPVDQVQHLLVEEANKGHLELRSDSGSARFTEAELSAAPCAPDGSRLIWIRLHEHST